MGDIPHRIFKIWTLIISCIIMLLTIMGYILQVPTFEEVPYIVYKNTLLADIISKDTGIIMFRYNQPHNIKTGDSIATIMKDNKRIYYISPINGTIESNFLYTTGDHIKKGDTLARVISNENPKYKLILKIPLNMKSNVQCGMKIKCAMEDATAEDAVGFIKKISVIPDKSNCYNAIVEMPMTMMQNIPSSGKAKLYYKTENIFKKLLTIK